MLAPTTTLKNVGRTKFTLTAQSQGDAWALPTPMTDDAEEKRLRTEGSMPSELREKIVTALAAVGEVEYQRRSHLRKCPLVAWVLPDADLVHERAETVN